ncbi:coiled-coil domain-containing protein 77 isoform X2 [Nilaparvata lugens]|uniref:coiled-coil domain-containing protein 77 isoform X2 n=1 Tax=Nilaparvata lugens TaxID=108931 RepID=UPI00193D78AC|nr:coiled-coil domain-containing protein 77 isoform X2 [Nilaparvata lugens]
MSDYTESDEIGTCTTKPDCQKMDSNYSIYDVDDHIQQMKPSRIMILHYQSKIEDMRKYERDLEAQLERCKKVCDKDWTTQEELLKRTDEVSELKKTVSDLQVFLYQEREHVLQLSAENDRLRLAQLDYQKKLDTVLSFTGLPNDFITFICTDPNVTIIPNKTTNNSKISMKRSMEKTKNKSKVIKDLTESRDEMEKLKVEALIAEWEEQSELYRDEIHSLLLDRDLRQKEWEEERKRLQNQIAHSNKMLKSLQSKVCDESWRFINMEKRHQARESVWLDERAELLKSIESIHQLLHVPSRNHQHIASQVSALKQLSKKDDLVNMYQEQSTTLEGELERLKDSMEKNKLQLKDKNSKMVNQVKYFKDKCEEEKRRRLLDAEGFRNDIKFLQNRVQTLERKVFTNYSQLHSDPGSRTKS